MLWRDTVCKLRRGIEVRYGDDRTEVTPTRPGDGAPFERFKKPVHRFAYRTPKGAVGGDQQRLGAFVMFRLAQQVERDPFRVIIRIGDDQNLGRAGDHVDAHLAEDPALGRRDKGVAGAGNLVHRGDGVGAIGQGRDGLRTADPVNLIDTGGPGGGEHKRVQHTVRRGHRHGKARHPGHLRRYRVHQNRGRIGCQPPRHVKPRRGNRRPAPAQRRARLIGPAGIFGQLTAVIGADTRRGAFQCVAFHCGHLLDRRFDLFFSDTQIIWAQRNTVEPVRQFDDRLVPPRADIGDDFRNGLIHVRRIFALGAQQGCERLLEIGLGVIQKLGHDRSCIGQKRGAARSERPGCLRRKYFRS